MARGLPGPRRRRLRLPEGDPAGLTIFAAYGSASTDAKPLNAQDRASTVGRNGLICSAAMILAEQPSAVQVGGYSRPCRKTR